MNLRFAGRFQQVGFIELPLQLNKKPDPTEGLSREVHHEPGLVVALKMTAVDLDGLNPVRCHAAYLADFISGRDVQLQSKHPRPLYGVHGQHVQRKPLGLELCLDQRVDHDPRLDLLQAQCELEGHGGVAVREGPVAACQGLGQLGRVDLQQAAHLGRLGSEALGHLHHDHALLPTDPQCLDHRDQDFGPI